MKLRLISARTLILSVLCFVPCSPVVGQTIDTTIFWPGDGGATGWGSSYPSVGQTFTTSSTALPYLKTATFYSQYLSGSALSYNVLLYRWKGSSIVGDAVWQSAARATSTSTDYTSINVDMNKVRLVSNAQYIAILRTVTTGNQAGGLYRLGRVTGDRYPAGNFLINYTDSLESGWEFPPGGSDRDLAFIFVFWPGPDANNTQTMVYRNAFDVNAALTHRTMVIAESLSYDCSIFDANDICVSWGGRYGNSGNSVNDGAGVLTVAYRFLPEFYVGAFVDQSAPMDYGTSIRSTGMDPTFGGFLVWQENPDQSGFRVRLSAARHNGNVRITREASLSNTEAGSGKTGLHSWGYGADISYGFNVNEDVLLLPYAGIRRSTARRQGYTEESWDSVEFPLSYRHMDRELTTATMGIRGTMRIDHGIRLLASAGMEYDVQTSQDAMTGTSSITDFNNFSLSSPTRKANRTRGVGSVGAQFRITSNAAFVVNTTLRQQAYTSDLSLGVMASVMVGF